MAFRQKKDPPANEADFERLCLKLLKAYWGSATLELYGRRGERQHGIDILDMSGTDPLRAAQCKLYDSRKPLPPSVLKNDIEAAKKFTPPLGIFAIMTNGRVSTELQNTIIEINRQHRRAALFTVELFTWDRIDGLLDEFPAIRDEEYKTLSGETARQIQNELAQISVQVSTLNLSASSGNSDKSDALHLEIDEARSLVQKGEAQTARFLLQRMRARKWDQMKPRHKFRLLSNIGAAFLYEHESKKAAEHFLEAAEFQPDDPQAAENKALAYLLSLPRQQAFAEISNLHKQFPKSSKIAVYWINTAPADLHAEELQAKLAITAATSAEPLAALAARALSELQFEFCRQLASRSLQQRPGWS